MVFAGEVRYLSDQSVLLHDADEAAIVRDGIAKGHVYVAKNVIPADLVGRIREYLANIGRNSLPNYHPIEKGCPNFHRLNVWDERSYVKGCFHQFVFFPWNQDVFGLFGLSRDTFRVKNILSGNPKERFWGGDPVEGVTCRIAFQFYPKGQGGMNRHVDPVDFHQITVPVLIMSEKGRDFTEGGAYVERESGEKIWVDEVAAPGDVVYFHAGIPHGVATINPHSEKDWLSFEGRWMMLFAVNKLAGEQNIPDAKDLTPQSAG